MYREAAGSLLRPADAGPEPQESHLVACGFRDPKAARADWNRVLSVDDGGLSEDLVTSLLGTMAQTAAPDMSLRHLRMCLEHWDNPCAWLKFLESHPRAVEILTRLFVNSQFLTEVLVKNPEFLQRLTESRRLAEVRSRDEFLDDMTACAEAATANSQDPLDAIRRVRRWEFLRIAACDCFGLMDHRRVTLQLSLLADACIQAVMNVVMPPEVQQECQLVVVALGKLGGEELNYSSDIDLLLLADGAPDVAVRCGQQLVRELGRMTGEGFLYRVDMRLRPWGRSGPLVSDVEAYLEYLQQHAAAWEWQALIKARVVAGERAVGESVLSRVSRLLVSGDVRPGTADVLDMKRRIEERIPVELRIHGEVKSGVGSIRDIEFVTQYLQLAHAERAPEVLGTNTLRALGALAGAGCLRSDQHRKLSTGYLLLRSIEHALQLMHNKQVHNLPTDPGELTYLARRLDFSDSGHFVGHFEEHCREIREVFDEVLGVTAKAASEDVAGSEAIAEPLYLEVFSDEQRKSHARLLSELERFGNVMMEPVWREEGRAELTVVAHDAKGLLTAITGLLVVHGVDIVSGHAFTFDDGNGRPCCVDAFEVTTPGRVSWDALWSAYHADLVETVDGLTTGRAEEVLAKLTARVADCVSDTTDVLRSLLPVEFDVDNSGDEDVTVLTVRADDTRGFLYECAHALSLAGISIRRVVIETDGEKVRDRLEVVDQSGHRIVDPGRLAELKTVVVLIKHFTHLLPQSPNPLTALRQFRELLKTLFAQDDWTAQVRSLERPEVLGAVARVLGVSEFLWQDFLRLQHETLFPVLASGELEEEPKSRQQLADLLSEELSACQSEPERVSCVNAFKDREMFLADMRHIIRPGRPFGAFSAELGNVAECVMQRVLEESVDAVSRKLGTSRPGRVAIAGLGKFGGRELGFASDIELLCVYDQDRPDGDRPGAPVAEFYRRVVERILQAIQSQRAGVFELDLRLRPHGQAGPLACSVEVYRAYYGNEGAAWPFERQALVKLRAVAGDRELGRQLELARDDWLYSDGRFDRAAMRAMRDRQVRQLVKAGTYNAKLSPGALVDCEYLVQGLQLEHGHRDTAVRATNTLEALDGLGTLGVLDQQTVDGVREAYKFHRRLIDSLRVVRGDARDLTVPARHSAEFRYLARRLDSKQGVVGLAHEIDRHSVFIERLAS